MKRLAFMFLLPLACSVKVDMQPMYANMIANAFLDDKLQETQTYMSLLVQMRKNGCTGEEEHIIAAAEDCIHDLSSYGAFFGYLPITDVKGELHIKVQEHIGTVESCLYENDCP